MAGLHWHTVRSLERWILGAGLKLHGPTDVRAYGRQALGMRLRAHGGRIMAVVGTGRLTPFCASDQQAGRVAR